MSSLFDLTGKTALVTGGTRGIGRAMALALAEAGADIILVQASIPHFPLGPPLTPPPPQRDINNSSTRDDIMSLGRACRTVLGDLSSSASVGFIIPDLVSNDSALPNGGIHILLNCAGIQRRHKAHEFPDTEWNEVVQTNLSTVFTLCRDVGSYWIQKGIRGRIVNVASLLSFQGGLNVAAYAAAKHGVVGITKALSNEWAGRGIGVNAIAPGYIATDMNTDLQQDQERNRQILERIPAGKWGSPEDFKGPVVFLASEKASGYVNGETIVVDGGWLGR
ncbi:NAD(P)-binding protein [Wilcoxina mikolae CBS 423.85]|nr:NAD(P)-binding protein [Wilcoxina mikolae CBS 423.85]